MDHAQLPIVQALQHCAVRPQAAFYAPGHKRGQGAAPALVELLGADCLRADLPELPELDNLFAPEGVIQQAQTLAADAFGAEHTYFLANGSTCGLEAAILATCGPGDKIVVPRNVHRSVIAGLVLAGAWPVFVAPAYDADLGLPLGLSVETLAVALEDHPDARAVVLVSPTYHGLCSEVGAIADLAHAHGIPLLVDEAHGPHFAFHPNLPAPALAQGADLVVQSTHKVLSALSQASMLHVQGPRIDRDRLQAALQLTQSTSPSYLLLASLDAARHQVVTEGKVLLGQTVDLALGLRQQLAAIPGLRVIDPAHIAAQPSLQALDLTRITIDVSGLGMTGLEADEILHDTYGVTAELPELRHLTLIVSLGNTPADGQRCVEGFRQLVDQVSAPASTKTALPQLSIAQSNALADSATHSVWTMPQVSPREAFFAPKETVSAAVAIGRLSAETLSAYPPGIPTVVAGEVITAAAIAYLKTVKQQGGYVTGNSDPTLESLTVLA